MTHSESEQNHDSDFPSPKSLRKRTEYHLKKTLGLGLKGVRSIENAVSQNLSLHIYKALSLGLRDRIMDNWIATNHEYQKRDMKRLFYFSAEYLTGRFMGNNLVNLNVQNEVKEFLESVGLNLNDVEDQEMDAGLGNGGLGRLAACFLDSIAALELPGHGYGLRYDYGIFRQQILDGYQVEFPDQWLQHGNPWEVQHEEDSVIVRFGGKLERKDFFAKKEKTSITKFDAVVAVPYDTPVIGYKSKTVNTLRLWSTSIPDYEQFDIGAFDRGEYEEALGNVISHDNLTMVSILYPNDNHDSGKRLRLKQQYILVSASVQDIVRSFRKNGSGFDTFSDKVAIQINDTHPSLVITELMRILVDEEELSWDTAWDITVRTCGYTNHTVLSEALEEWKAHMMKELLPRNYEIVEIINHDFCTWLFQKYSNDMDLIRRVSVIENGNVRMANLAIVGSHSVNGVAKLHTSILKNQLLRDFNNIYPEKFNNKTNGVTPRRWLYKANPGLSELISEKIGTGWITDLSELKRLEPFAGESEFLDRLMEIKHKNKLRLKEYILNNNPVRDANGVPVKSVEVDPGSIFDVHAKRLHEYKRQLLNALHILMLYNDIKENPGKPVVARTFLFAAKSAPGYYRAKGIIKFINILADVINDDPDVDGRIKVVYLENYNVSLAELLLPAGDVSEQISTAGLEASGTGNMKLAMNGALTIGTMDGANVEMSEEIGEENMFIFGLRADEVKSARESGYNPRDVYTRCPEIQRLVDQLWSDELTKKAGEMEVLKEIADSIASEDRFFVLKDLMAYKEAQRGVATLYKDKRAWAARVTLNIARMGKFSSDRTIMEYNKDIWHLKKIQVP